MPARKNEVKSCANLFRRIGVRAKISPSAFARKAYAVCLRLPRGKVATYQQLARAIGHPYASRAVGHALNRNPFAPAVPCHRVVRSDGKIGGFTCGTTAKARLLRAEGIVIVNGRLDLTKFGVHWPRLSPPRLKPDSHGHSH